MKPEVGSEPDIRCNLLKRRILIECKRPLSAASLTRQVSEAARQLARKLRIECDPRDCGLIAISVTRAFTTGEQRLEVSRPDQVTEFLHGELCKITAQHEQSWKEVIRDPKIAGVVLELTTPGLIIEDNLLIAASQKLVVHIEGKSDAALLEELAAVMKIALSRQGPRGMGDNRSDVC